LEFLGIFAVDLESFHPVGRKISKSPARDGFFKRNVVVDFFDDFFFIRLAIQFPSLILRLRFPMIAGLLTRASKIERQADQNRHQRRSNQFCFESDFAGCFAGRNQ
jgi:hypothetical protein